jgi:CRP/FNR family cyclic AMP-dependent transcriptional regulator
LCLRAKQPLGCARSTMPPNSIAEFLEHPALTAVMTDSLRTLAACGDLRRYRKSTVLIEEGERGDSLYIILSGRLRAYSAGPNGRELTHGVYGPGEYLGEMSLDGGPRSASVDTLEASTCSVVTRQTLHEHIARHPDFAFELLSKIIRRTRAATLSAKQLALNDVYGRLRLLLDALSVKQADGSRRTSERLTHQEIASRLGCSREMVSRLMKDLDRGGYIRVEGANAAGITVLRPLPPRW